MRVLTLTAALALAACSPSGCSNNAKQDEPNAETAQTEAANGCAATASSQWTSGGETLTVEASTTGADCASAEARMSLKRADGGEMYGQVFQASAIQTLAGAESAEDMQRRLNEWVSPPGAAPDSTGDLPEWAANAEYPGESASPFRPYGGMERADYAALRTRDAPMFCFDQSLQSSACFWLDAGAFRRIGEQQFPG